MNGQRIGYKKKNILRNDDVISLSHPNFKTFVYKDLSPNEAHNMPKSISLDYHIGRKLGAGVCGIVRLVYNRKTCESYAMKQVQKNKLMESSNEKENKVDPMRVMNEVLIMKSLDHPCVIKMHNIIDNYDSVFILLELMKGGDLLSRIVGKKRLNEQISKLYFIQMCYAVKYLHDKNITHRDLKPDNVLLATTDEETLIKVSDFGLSKSDATMRTLCGTPLYVAPEILSTGGRGLYTNKVDVWSLGVVLYSCLSGSLPFSDEYGTPAVDQIKKARFSFGASAWNNVSKNAKALIKLMLTVDPIKRPSIKDLFRHVWLRDPEVMAKAHKLMNIKEGDTVVPAPVTDDNNDNKQTIKLTIEMDEECMKPPAAKRRRIERLAIKK